MSNILIGKTNEILVANGYTELDTNDKIVMGDFVFTKDGKTLRNAMIVKDGTVLNDVQPVIANEGFYPAFCPSAVDAKIALSGNFGNWSYVYRYRRG